MPESKYPLVIIGGGPAGYTAAIRAAQLGIKTALVEKQSKLGGTCLNVGCIPSKALLTSSEHYYNAKYKMEAHGVVIKDLSLDISAMMQRKNQAVETLAKGLNFLMRKNGVDVIHGTAHLVGTNNVFVKTETENFTIGAECIILAAGSVPQELTFLKSDGARVLTSDDALSLENVPQSMMVIGAGAVGLELGSVWSRLGAKVTFVEMLPAIAAGMDKEIASGLQTSLTTQGMEFHLSATVQSAEVKDHCVALKIATANGELDWEAEKVLVAAGRRPYTDELFLEEAEIHCDEKGFIEVNEHWQTKVPTIYAIGDLIRGPMLAHRAMEEGVALVERLAGKAGMVNEALLPRIVYTAPEAAAVGITEEIAHERGYQYRIGKSSFSHNGRAVASGLTKGFVKLIADAQTDRLIGAHILGAEASELIAECIMLMEFGGSVEDLARSMHAHPTLNEAIKEAAWSIHPRLGGHAE
ncbi:MAG: dihydrolipoyl dehydrogenase [Verrucomicrobiota bacterium]